MRKITQDQTHHEITSEKHGKTTEKKNSYDIDHWDWVPDPLSSPVLLCLQCLRPNISQPLDPSIASINSTHWPDAIAATMTMWYHLVSSQKNKVKTHPQTCILTQLLHAFFASSSSSRSRLIFASSRMSSWEITSKYSWQTTWKKRANCRIFTVNSKNAKGDRHSTAGHLQSFNWSTLLRQGSSASSSSSSSSVQQVTRKTGLLVECWCCAFRFRLSVLFTNKVLPCIPLLTAISLFLFSIQVSSPELDKISHSQGRCWVWDHPPHPSFPVR